MRTLTAAVAIVALAGCGRGASNPQSPSPPPALPTTVPPFAVTGVVFDTVGRRVSGALIEVSDGPQKGLAASTNQNGEFSFEPLFTTHVIFRASKPGYLSDSRSAFGTIAHLSFRLDSVRPAASLAGTYTVTFEADSTCTALPELARRRTYTATINTSSLVELSGATFGPDFNGYGWHWMYRSQFEDVGKFHFSDGSIWELLGEDGGSYIEIYGDTEAGRVVDATFQLPFWARITYCAERDEADHYPECEVPPITCTSSNHHVTFTKR